MDAKFVIGAILGFVGAGFVLHTFISPLIGKQEGTWMLKQWAPALNQATARMPPQERAKLHTMLQSKQQGMPEIAREMHAAGINW